MKRVITISREFGSGGREIGFCLAEKLGIPFYDKEIISMAAADSNIAEDVFHAHDEVLRHQEQTDHKYVSVNPFSVLYEVPVQDQLFMAQSQIIRRLEQAGYIRTYWGDETVGARRRYYSITEEGRRAYQVYKRDWEEAKADIDRLLK